MVRKCMVSLCPNKGEIPGIQYFTLTPSRRKSWLKVIGKDLASEVLPSDMAQYRVCSEHFSKNDLIIMNNLITLRPGAVPQYNLGPRKPLVVAQVSRAPPSPLFNVGESSTSQHIFRETAFDLFQFVLFFYMLLSIWLHYVQKAKSRQSRRNNNLPSSPISDVTNQEVPLEHNVENEDVRGLILKLNKHKDHTYCSPPDVPIAVLRDTKEKLSSAHRKVFDQNKKIARLRNKVIKLKKRIKQLETEQKERGANLMFRRE